MQIYMLRIKMEEKLYTAVCDTNILILKLIGYGYGISLYMYINLYNGYACLYIVRKYPIQIKYKILSILGKAI